MDFKSELFELVNYYVMSAIKHNDDMRSGNEVNMRLAETEMTALNVAFDSEVDALLVKYYGGMSNESEVFGENEE